MNKIVKLIGGFSRMDWGSIHRRIGPSFLANIYNQLVVVLTQLVIMPLMIGALGIGGFGTWLVLAAIPAYLTISDLGFSYSAKSDMSVRMMAGDVTGAVETISSVAFLMSVILAGFSVLYIAATYLVDWTGALGLHGVTPHDAHIILLCGLVQIIGYQAFMVSAAILRADRKPAMESFMAGNLRLLESLALVAGAYLSRNLVVAAIAWAATRTITTLLATIYVLVKTPSLRPQFKAIKAERMRELLKPSLAFMMMPLANSFLLQGTTLILSVSAGAVGVASFNIFRTITRMGVSIGNTLNATFVPQYSYAYGSSDVKQFKNLLKLHVGILCAGAVAYLVVQVALGPFFTGLLSHKQVAFSLGLFAILLVSATLEMVWSVPLTVASANNRVGFITVAYVICAAVYIGVSALLASVISAIWLAVGLVIVNLVMSVVAFGWLLRQGVVSLPAKVVAEGE